MKFFIRILAAFWWLLFSVSAVMVWLVFPSLRVDQAVPWWLPFAIPTILVSIIGIAVATVVTGDE